MSLFWFLLGVLLGALPVAVLYELFVRRRLMIVLAQATADAAALRAARLSQDRLARDLRSESSDLQERLHKTLQRLKKESVARRESEAQLARTLAAVATLRAGHEEAQRKLEADLAEVQRQARGTVRKLERRLGDSEAALQRRASGTAGLAQEKEALALELSDSLERIASLETRIEAADEARRQSEKQLAEAHERAARLAEQLADVEALVGQFPLQQMAIRGLQKERAAALARQEQLREQLQAAAALARRLDGRYRQTLVVLRRLLRHRAAPSSPAPPGGNGEHPERRQPADPVAELRRVHGIGPTYAQRLLENGIASLAALAASTPADLSRAAGLRPHQGARAAAWIDQARSLSPAAADGNASV